MSAFTANQFPHTAAELPSARQAGAVRERPLDLTLSDVRELTEAVTRDAGRHDRPFGSYVFAPADPAAALARHVEQAVFEESFGSTGDQLEAEFAPYDAASLWFCVIDHVRQLPVGSARIIVPNPVGLKTLDDLEIVWGQPAVEVLARNQLALDEGRAWDIATLAVAPGYRNRLVSQALHQAICSASVPAGVDWFVAVLDTRVLRLLQAQLARVFRTFDGVDPAMYSGSVSVPVWSDLVAFRRRLAEQAPELLETIFEGRHLEVVLSTPEWPEVARAASELVASCHRQPPALAGRAA